MTSPRPAETDAPERRRRDKTDLATPAAVLFALGAVAVAVFLVMSGGDETVDASSSPASDSIDVSSSVQQTDQSAQTTDDVATASPLTATSGTTPLPSVTGLEGVLNGGTVTLTGSVPDDGAEVQIVQVVERVFGAGSVRADLTVDPSVASPTSMKLTVADTVLFAPGSEDIQDAFFPLLDQISALMANDPQVNLIINGHTDSGGDQVSNLALSQRRADTARAYLVNEQGIDGFRVEAVGRGSSEPLADNESEAGRQANRRIEFEILGMRLAEQ